MKILDAHTHIFPPEIIRKRDKIAQSDSGFGIIYKDRASKMADVDKLLTYMETGGIEACVACSFPFKDSGLMTLQNDYILEAGRDNAHILPLIAVDIGDGRAATNEMERCMKKGALGAGELAFYDRGLGRDEIGALEGVASGLEEFGGVLMLHVNEQVGHAYKGKTNVDLPEVVRFVERHRNLALILAHLGGGLCFYEFMPEVKEAFSKVFYDTAASPFLYTDAIYGFIGEFLFDKVLFGSDFPLTSFSRYGEGMMHIQEERREMILSSNARRVFTAKLVGRKR